MPYNTIIMGDQIRYFYLYGNGTGDIYCTIRVSVSAGLVAAFFLCMDFYMLKLNLNCFTLFIYYLLYILNNLYFIIFYAVLYKAPKIRWILALYKFLFYYYYYMIKIQ